VKPIATFHHVPFVRHHLAGEVEACEVKNAAAAAAGIIAPSREANNTAAASAA
jgi:hypothetical protein